MTTDYFAFVMLMFYFMFLYGIFYMSRNVEQIAQHPMMGALVEKFQDNVRYNLRDIPRVDYTEPASSSDEEYEGTSEASEEESEVQSNEGLRRRRDPNPIARLIEEVD